MMCKPPVSQGRISLAPRLPARLPDKESQIGCAHGFIHVPHSSMQRASTMLARQSLTIILVLVLLLIIIIVDEDINQRLRIGPDCKQLLRR